MYKKKRLNKDWQSYEHYEVHCSKIQQTRLAMLPTKPRKNTDKCQFFFPLTEKKQECNYNNGKRSKALNILEQKRALYIFECAIDAKGKNN